MARALRTVKIVGLVLAILLTVAGSGYMLVKLEILAVPTIMQKIPLPGITQKDPAVPETYREEVPIPGPDLDEVQAEVVELQAKLELSEQALEQSLANEIQLKGEVARLNQEILDLKAGDSAKRATYKDMAAYFVSMKAKDAADIISRLKDEDVIGILSSMDKEAAAEILPQMDRDRAAAIAAKMLVVSP